VSLDGKLLRLEILSCTNHGVIFYDAPSLRIGRECLFTTRYARRTAGLAPTCLNLPVDRDSLLRLHESLALAELVGIDYRPA